MRYVSDILLRNEYEVLCFLDNSKVKQGTQINGINVIAPERVNDFAYSEIAIVTPGFEDDIVQQLVEIGVDEAKIVIPASGIREGNHIEIRKIWITDFANMAYSRVIPGSVAEAGVFRGDFAKHINANFPDKTLYLFDTFEGFPAKDVEREGQPANAKAGYYDATNEEVVLKKLPYPEKAILRKGYFPETAQGINDRFCFVNLDLDLYQPTLEGLKFFYERMSDCGVILIHDYFSLDFPNVITAVTDYEQIIGIKLKMMPIGDTLSVAIVK